MYAGLWFPGETEKNEKNLKKVFSNYQVNDILIRNAKPDAIVLHCLPAHRGQEITAELFETHAKEIFDQSENRLHAQKAVLVRLLGGRARRESGKKFYPFFRFYRENGRV